MQMNRPPNGCSVRPDFKNYSTDCSAIYYKLCISHFHPGFSRVRERGHSGAKVPGFDGSIGDVREY